MFRFIKSLLRYRLKIVRYMTDEGKRGKVKVGRETYLYNPYYNPHLEQGGSGHDNNRKGA